MNDPKIKKSQFFRIVGLGFVILPTLLLLCAIIDLLTYLAVPWQYAGFNEYLLLKESAFWIQYTQHCAFFEAKWITRFVWHFSWLFSLLGIIIVNKFEHNSLKKNNDTNISLENDKTYTENVKRSKITYQNSIIIIHIFLITVGTVVMIIINKHYIFWIFPSILPQFFLMKILPRIFFQKLKFKRDFITIPLLMIILLLSFPLFGRLLCA